MARYCGSCEFWWNAKCCNPISDFRGKEMIDPSFKCPINSNDKNDLRVKIANDICDIKEHLCYGNNPDFTECKKDIIKCIQIITKLAESGDLDYYYYFSYEISNLITNLKKEEAKRYDIKYVPLS